jgi:hypothetical protein
MLPHEMPLLAVTYFTKDELKLYFVGDVGSDREVRTFAWQGGTRGSAMIFGLAFR